MNDIAIKIDNVCKEYRLGAIGGATLREDVNRWLAKLRGKEDPYLRIGQKQHLHNEKFMALDDVSMTVHKGEQVGIIGHNGAGKSTLLKLLSRVTAPTSGTIAYNGRISSMLEVGTGFHGELTGRENIFMNGAILGMTKKEIESKLDDIIAFAEMEQFIDTPVKRYSSGMYVKLAFAVAAHLDNEILIMDEVLAVGDMKFQQKSLGKMSDVSSQDGKTVLYVSHNMGTIKQLCTRCIVLNQGKIVFDGDVDQAIDLYLANDASAMQQHLDVSKFKRDSHCSGSIFIEGVNFVHQDAIVPAQADEIRLSLTCSVQKTIDEVFLRATIIDDKAQPVGICTSNSMDFARAGKVKIDLSLPASILFSGRYNIRLILYRSNFKLVEVIDCVENSCFFEKEEDFSLLNTEYTKRLHGNVNFGTLGSRVEYVSQ